jgi:hypothetical protein
VSCKRVLATRKASPQPAPRLARALPLECTTEHRSLSGAFENAMSSKLALSVPRPDETNCVQ